MKASIHRPTRAIVDLSSISFNIEQVRRHLPVTCKIFAVVKANAYGHGAVAVSTFIEQQVSGFCVSNLDEAIELRQAGIQKPILVLGVTTREFVPLAIRENIILTIASLDWLRGVVEEGKNLIGLECHIKVDSGMGRLGFHYSNEINYAIKTLRTCGAKITGLFTHLATADELGTGKFEEQVSKFTRILGELDRRPPLVHVSNSAASLWHSRALFDVVRLGNVIYGMNPSDGTLELPYEILPALMLESEIVHVKKLKKGQTVGYGATYKLKNDEYIATIPIGYADGWARDLQGFHVLVNGEYCPIVGRISMDQTTIRLIEPYSLGTKVTLIGTDGNRAITVTDVATQKKTVNYEVLCSLTDRIPRFYQK